MLVLDESMPQGLAGELARRGREALGLSALGLRGALDPDLLLSINAQFSGPWVLVTADDRLPEERTDAIAAVTATVATIDPDRPPKLGADAWRREIVHRWAHAMQAQPPGTARRYGPAGPREWGVPRRRPREG